MMIEHRLKKLEKTLRFGVKPELYGTPIAGWSAKKEAKLLAEASRLKASLPRPILGSLSTKI